jgi:biotin synthase
MGAAQTRIRDNRDFEAVLEMVKGVKSLGLECCVTLGMLDKTQANRLKEAGLTAYNHNVDTSEEFYPKIVTTRTYQERIDTLEAVGDAGISVCCGGILGLGESDQDRIKMLHTLCRLKTAPESIPINALVPCKGTPLEKRAAVSPLDLVRMIATTRIVFPKARVRLSAGRESLTYSDQALCFLAGANSIFSGEKLLTTPNPKVDSDQQMFNLLGLNKSA